MEETADLVAELLKKQVVERAFRIHVVGPADAAVAKVNDVYRKVVYLKGEQHEELVQMKDALENYCQSQNAFSGALIQFDFNPATGF